MAELDLSTLTLDDVEEEEEQKLGEAPKIGGGATPLDLDGLTPEDVDDDDRKVIDLHSNLNPAEQRKQGNAARRLGVPQRVVESDLNEALKTITVEDLDEKTKDRPKTRKEILDSNVGPAIQDDVDSFIEIEDIANRAREFSGSMIGDVFGGSLFGLGELLNISDRATKNALRSLNLGVIADAFDNIDGALPWWLKPADILKEPGATLRNVGKEIDSGEDSIAADLTRGLGQLTGQVAVHILTGGTASLPTLIGQGANIMKEKTQDLEAKGAVSEALGDQTAKDTAVVTGAAITALTEKYGIDKLLNRVPPKIKNGFMRWLADLTVAFGIEASQEVLEGVLHDLTVVAVVNPDAEIFQGLDREAIAAGGSAAIFRGLVNAAVKGRQISHERQQKLRAEQHHARLAKVLETSDLSTVAAESPELFQEVLERITADTDLETVRVNAGGLHAMYEAAENPNAALEFFQEAGIPPREIEQAISLGLDVAVPIGKFVNGVKEAEFREIVLMNVRDGMDAPTLAEAQVAQDEVSAKTSEIIKQVIGDTDTTKTDTAAADIGDAIAAQIAETGIYSAEGSKQFGAMIQSALESEQREAELRGEEFDVAEFFTDTGLNIRRQNYADYQAERLGAPTQQVLTQAGTPIDDVYTYDDFARDVNGELPQEMFLARSDRSASTYLDLPSVPGLRLRFSDHGDVHVDPLRPKLEIGIGRLEEVNAIAGAAGVASVLRGIDSRLAAELPAMQSEAQAIAEDQGYEFTEDPGPARLQEAWEQFSQEVLEDRLDNLTILVEGEFDTFDPNNANILRQTTPAQRIDPLDSITDFGSATVTLQFEDGTSKVVPAARALEDLKAREQAAQRLLECVSAG